MNKLIQVKIHNVLKEFDISIPLNSIEVTKPNKKIFGDYTTNILLKHNYLDHNIFIERLSKDSSFEKIEFVNGFVNIFLSAEKMDFKELVINEKIELKQKYLFRRIKNVHHRLEEEGFEFSGYNLKDEYYINMVKSYNNLLENTMYLGCANSTDLSSFFKSFEHFDGKIVYRKLNFSELGEIKNLFDSVILLIERITYE